jgi:cation diffusion facilitator CzcD-associated flavoprotein CzcO
MASAAIIGAGPNGLSVAAYLDEAGVETTIYGTPMEFWAAGMPRGMRLRSTWRASSIASPGGRLTLDAYEQLHGAPLDRLIPLEEYVRYGRWFATRLRATIDQRRIALLERETNGFVLTTADGERAGADFVVVAAGVDRFAHIPAQFRGLPPRLVSHSLGRTGFDDCRGRRVAVIGSGQSALEYAALLHEAGASVTIIARTRMVRWLSEAPSSQTRLARTVRCAMYPPTGVGPRGLNWIAALPDLFRPLPPGVRVRAMNRCLRPVGAHWLERRLHQVSCRLGCQVQSVSEHGEGLRLQLSDGSTEEPDHVVLATGYRVNVARYPFLGPTVRRDIAEDRGFPRLGTGLESSVGRLHFVGAAASLSFGPVMRFVVGSWYAGPAVADRIAGRRTRRLRRAYA